MIKSGAKNEAQVEYLDRSLEKIARRRRGEIVAAALALLAILLVAGGSLYRIQSNALDTELKNALAKLEIAQENVLRAENRRSGLEALLKREQERARESQENADQAFAQSGVLANQLEETQGKVQAARAGADEAIAQSSALQIKLKETQGKLEEARAHAEQAEFQRGTLETLLRSDQEKTREIQSNADTAFARRNVLETELREAQEKLQAAQVNAEQAVRQRQTLDLKKDEAEPARGVQALMEIARVDSGNAPARPSVPASIAKVAAPPAHSAPWNQVDQPDTLTSEVESVRAFVLDYLRTIAVNDVSTQERFFADRVNFYSRGVLPLAKVQDATQGYHDEWPVREWNPRGPATVSRASDLFVVLQPFTWSVSDGSQSSHGDATLYLRIRKNPQGEFRIVKVEQREE
jgi:hypothetical protein